ncbi:MAG: hypothetical protein K1X72_29035 [Pyrinomonadaceae bacterium]|nr:hypothetical protein [Pyrinomonadaceae bacterium]
MHRKVSSITLTDFYQTGFVLFLFPLFLILISINIQISKNWFEFISYLLAFSTIFIVIINLLFKLKKVEVVDENKGLIIQTTSWFSRKRILIPWENIQNVSQVFLMNNPEIVTIELKIPCDFGRKIRFIPVFRFLSFGEHPIVEELNQKINQLN